MLPISIGIIHQISSKFFRYRTIHKTRTYQKEKTEKKKDNKYLL
jgi:hypothetical protein